MTYREWFVATCEPFGLDKKRIDLIMFNRGLNPDDEADPITAKKALCMEIEILLPIQNVSEGGLSLSYNWEVIKAWYSSTCASLGIGNKIAPKVRNRSNIW